MIANFKLERRIMQQGDIEWGSVLGGAAMAKVIEAIVNYFLAVRKSKKNASKTITDTVQIYKSLQSIPEHQCLRRTVLTAHNGGKMLNTRTHKYVSMLYEDYRTPFESTIDEFQQWRMDEQYAHMLEKVINEKVVHVYTRDIPASKLKDMYESQDVKYSVAVYLGEDGSNLYYAVFSSNQDLMQFDVDTRHHINQTIDKITKLLHL